MELPIWIVDAFTDRPFAGNPAAVCLTEKPLAEETMRRVAAEMNLSETAFPVPEGEGFRLRWFTPQVEVPLCGHATLATCHVLWSEGFLPPDRPARFETRSGLLSARRDGDWIELDFPARECTPASPDGTVLRALGCPAVSTWKTADNWLIEVADVATVRRLTPDFARLGTLVEHGVIVTARGEEEGIDFVSRFFAPAYGVAEDPVTGSAHCSLVSFWAGKLKKTEFVARQLSARGGLLRLRLAGERVAIAGQAVTVVRGKLELPD